MFGLLIFTSRLTPTKAATKKSHHRRKQTTTDRTGAGVGVGVGVGWGKLLQIINESSSWKSNFLWQAADISTRSQTRIQKCSRGASKWKQKSEIKYRPNYTAGGTAAGNGITSDLLWFYGLVDGARLFAFRPSGVAGSMAGRNGVGVGVGELTAFYYEPVYCVILTPLMIAVPCHNGVSSIW